MSNALTTTAQGALVPLAEIERAAQYISASGLFGVKTKEQATALMLVAQSEGLHYARAALSYDVIQGRPALKSSEILSRFQQAGGKIQYKKSDAAACVVELSHPQGGSIEIRWDMERAKKAGLASKDNWNKYPEAMLRARAVSEGVRALYPACLGGLYASEEVQDFEPPSAPAAPIPAEAAEVLESAPLIEAAEPKPEPSKPDYSVNLGGPTNASPAPAEGRKMTSAEKKKFYGFIMGLPQREMLKALGEFCEPKDWESLPVPQAKELAAKLSQSCDVYAPVIFDSEEDI